MTVTRQAMRLTMTAGIHARFAHRVDGLVHSHPWLIEATVEGPADAAKVMPADDLEAILQHAVDGWRGKYLTDEDLGPWKGYVAARVGRRTDGRGDRPPALGPPQRGRSPSLVSLAVVESTEFDRSRTVRLSVER